MSCGMLSFFERFLAFERDADLFSRQVCGVRFWHYIRFPFYSTMILPYFVPMGKAHPDITGGSAAKVKKKARRGRLYRWIERIRFDPSLAFRRRAVLFALTPRITRVTDGRRVRLAVDFFLGKLKAPCAVLEFPVLGTGYVAHDGGGRVFHWREAQRAVKAFKSSEMFAGMAAELDLAVKRLTEEVYAAFGMEADKAWLLQRIEAAVALDRVGVPVFRRWLERLGVKCVVEVVHYSEKNLALTRAAHDLGIPVAELQHGTVYPAHAAYNLPVADSPYSPDYLLGWGGWWLRQTRNFPAKRAVAAGYPFLEDALVENPRKQHGGLPLVLFISQGTIGKQLSGLAVELRRILKTECRIVFKLHPNEMRSWRTLYPVLTDSGVEVADDATRGIYSWLAEADAVAGVYSTAMIEGFVWGAKAYVFKSLPGADVMESFCTGGSAEYVDGAEDLAVRLRMQFAAGRSGETSFDRTDFFVDDAAANVAAAIDRIAEGKEP